MEKYSKYVVIGVILILVPIYMVLTQAGQFIVNEYIQVEYIIEEGFDISEVASIVSLNTGVAEKQIDVKITDEGHLNIKLPFAETYEKQSITRDLGAKYGDSIELRAYMFVGPHEYTVAFYILSAIFFIALVVGVILVVKGLVKFSKNAKNNRIKTSRDILS